MRLGKAQGCAALAAAVVTVAAAGCGSSSSQAGVVLAPQGGATAPSLSKTTNSTSTSTTPTTTTASVATPTTGPLSREPVLHKISGAPPTKLVTKDLVVGTGATAKSGSSIVVNYVGALYKTNKIFDSSWKRHQTFGPFTLGQGAVIKGWDEGIVGMKVGGRRELIIPSALAYGSAGSPPTIPPNAALVFVVDLLSAK